MQWKDWECKLGLSVTPKPILLPLLCAVVVIVVQSPSCVQLLQPHELQPPGLPVPHHSPEFAQVHVH